MAGEIPFCGENSLQVILKHLHETPKALPYKTQRQYELTQVVSKCMAKNPAQRYQSMKELLEALQKIAIAPLNEKAQIRQDNLSRSYSELPTGVSSNNWQPIVGGIAAVALVVLAVACVIPLWGVIQKQISPGGDYSVKATLNGKPVSVMQQVVETHQPSNSASGQLERSEVASQATAERLRKLEEAAAEQKAAAERERAAAEQQRIAAERERAAAADERVAAAEQRAAAAEQSAAASKSAASDMATRAMWLEKVRALGAANQRQFNAITEQQKALNSLDHATESLEKSNRTLRQYNDQMARPSGAGR